MCEASSSGTKYNSDKKERTKLAPVWSAYLNILDKKARARCYSNVVIGIELTMPCVRINSVSQNPVCTFDCYFIYVHIASFE